MKRICTALTAVLLLLCCSFTAFAAEPGETVADVMAKYSDAAPWNAVMPDGDGTAAVRLPDGTEAEVSGIGKSGWQLVIDTVTEKEPLAWIESVLGGKLTGTTALHIFFLDENGTAHSADGITVTIDMQKALKNAAVYAVRSDGKVKSSTGSVGGTQLTFTLDGSPFYAYGSQPANAPDTPGSPPTGDDSRSELWLALLIVSGTALTAALVCLLSDCRQKGANRDL